MLDSVTITTMRVVKIGGPARRSHTLGDYILCALRDGADSVTITANQTDQTLAERADEN